MELAQQKLGEQQVTVCHGMSYVGSWIATTILPFGKQTLRITHLYSFTDNRPLKNEDFQYPLFVYQMVYGMFMLNVQLMSFPQVEKTLGFADHIMESWARNRWTKVAQTHNNSANHAPKMHHRD